MNSPPPGSAHLNYTVGTLVAMGGAVGYVQKRSVPSLVAGVGIGYPSRHTPKHTDPPLHTRTLFTYYLLLPAWKRRLIRSVVAVVGWRVLQCVVRLQRVLDIKRTE